MTSTDAAITRTLHQNLGRGIIRLANFADPFGAANAGDDIKFGKQIDALIGTVVKAVLEGRQTDKQIRAKQQAARQAFARSLARKIARLG